MKKHITVKASRSGSKVTLVATKMNGQRTKKIRCSTVDGATVEELQAGMKRFNQKHDKVGRQLDNLKDKTIKKFGKQAIKSSEVETYDLEDSVGQVWGEIRMELNRQLNRPDNIMDDSAPFMIDSFYEGEDVMFQITFKSKLDWDKMEEIEAAIADIAKYYGPTSGYAEISNINEIMCGISKAEIVMEDITSASTLPGPGDYNPPEYDEPDEIEFSEQIEVDLDCVIVIDSSGSWEYEDTSYPWAQGFGSNGTWYTDEHNVYIGDPVDIVEYVDDMLEAYLPDTPGRYQLYGTAMLSFNISDIYKTSSFQGMDEDNDPIVDEEFYRDDANVDFDFGNSYISNFDCEPLE